MKMNTQQSFEEISKQIADSFIESIVFIDECAYDGMQGQKENEFDAQKVSATFARKNKLCSIYSPQKVSELKAMQSLLHKADVIVLDWRLNIEDDLNEEVDSEADAQEIDSRGKYTIPIINQIIEDAGHEKIKLVIVYTGETDLMSICDSIAKALSSGKTIYVNEDCTLQVEKVKIIVRAKKGHPDKYKHLGEDFKKLIISYEDLPDLILSHFMQMTDGILSNFALSAITEIRKSTFKILGVFSKDLDAAYIAHRNLIRHPKDATEMLMEIFSTAIYDLLETSQIDTEKWLHSWIQSKCKTSLTHEIEDIDSNGKKSITRIPVTSDSLMNIVDFEISKDSQSRYNNIKDEKNNTYSEKKAKKHATQFFCLQGENESQTNHLFALITQNKHLFTSITHPILTQGTILKSEENKYYICIQPVCDCARVPLEGRNFIFLPLEDHGEISIVLDANLCKYVDLHPYKMCVIHFMPQSAHSPVTPAALDDKLFFISGEKKFEWIMTLKRIYAQNITEMVSSNLSRVGLNISEWLRAQDN